MPAFDSASIEKELRNEADKQQISAARIIHPLRLAVSGVSVGPSLFHMLELLGKDTVIRRINKAIEELG
jgi:glutamyl-tRNA synthetase